MLGQVNAHAALLARERDVALHELGAEDGVHARADRVVEAQPPVQHEDVRGDAAEQHVGVDDLRPLPCGLLGLDEDGAGPGGLEDARALLGAERWHDHERGVEDLHARVTSVTTSPAWWPTIRPGPPRDVGPGILPRLRAAGGRAGQDHRGADRTQDLRSRAMPLASSSIAMIWTKVRWLRPVWIRPPA